MAAASSSSLLRVPAVPRLLPGPAGKLQQLAAAGALEQATPELLGLKDGATLTSSSSATSRLQDAALQSPAWVAARAFVAQQEARSGGMQQLRSIEDARALSVGKLPLMLVVLGSLQPSGSGSAFAKAKDASGSIGAALHASVLAVQPSLAAGAVLLLQQVSVFTPAPGSSFLAVTDKNVQQVWQAEAGWPGFQPRVHRRLQQQAHTQQPPSTPAGSSSSQQQQQQQQQQGAVPGWQAQAARLSQQQQQQQPWRRPSTAVPQASGTGQNSSVLPPPSPDIQTVLQLPRVGGTPAGGSQRQPPLLQGAPPMLQQQRQQGPPSQEQWWQPSSQQQWPSQPGPHAATPPASALASAPPGTSALPPPRVQVAAHDRACMPPPLPRMQPSSFRQQAQQQQWCSTAAPRAAAADDLEALLEELADIDAGTAASDSGGKAAAAAAAGTAAAAVAAVGTSAGASAQPVSSQQPGCGRRSGGASWPKGAPLQLGGQENECGDDVVRAIFGSQLCGLQQGGGIEPMQRAASGAALGWRPIATVAGCMAPPPPLPPHKRARVDGAGMAAGGGAQPPPPRSLSLLDDLEVDESEFGVLL